MRGLKIKLKASPLTFSVCVLLVIVHLCFAQAGSRGPELAPDAARLLYVIDGDTLIARYQERKEHLRLIGIDAPESRDNDKAERDARRSGQRVKEIVRLGQSATRWLRAKIKPGAELRLEFDVERRDKYGRLLAYVYLADGQMLNEVIVRQGYASLLTIPPNVRYAGRFRQALRAARAERLGLWESQAFAD